jgi:hypothetical protein
LGEKHDITMPATAGSGRVPGSGFQSPAVHIVVGGSASRQQAGRCADLFPGQGSCDPKLLNRPMRLGGRLFQDTHLLQVLEVNSIVKGQLCEVYYWCEICSIHRNEKLKQCECCGGPMELKEVPLKK